MREKDVGRLGRGREPKREIERGRDLNESQKQRCLRHHPHHPETTGSTAFHRIACCLRISKLNKAVFHM